MPGTRYIGFAIFRGHELVDWGIRNLPGRWSRDKLKMGMGFISDVIVHNEIEVLSIKGLHPSRSSHNLNQFVARIKEFSRRRGLEVHQYGIGDIKAPFHPDINRRQLAEMVSSEYPVLFYELQREMSIMNPYYIRMFEAVALGFTCFNHLDGRK